MSGHVLYATAWLAFALGHSGLAGRDLAGRWSRIVYNIIAVAAFVATMSVGRAALGDRPAFDFPAVLTAIMAALHLGGWALLVYCARFYDLGRLGGLTQLRHPDLAPDEGLRTDGPHGRVRHPLYAAAFLILWGAALSPLGLATAIWGSLYLLAGTWCEERRLLARYGNAYTEYRARVPPFVPWKDRSL